MMGRRVVLALATVAALVAAPLRAEGPLSDLSFIPACLMVSDDIDSITAALAQAGWEVRAELTDAMVEDIAWINSTFYFSGDTGGETLGNVLELQRKAARGMARKVDTPQSKTRFLTHEGETLVLAVNTDHAGATSVACRVAAEPSTMAGLRASLGGSGADPAYMPLKTLHQGKARIDITLLNADRLAGYDAPDAIVFTHAAQGG